MLSDRMLNVGNNRFARAINRNIDGEAYNVLLNHVVLTMTTPTSYMFHYLYLLTFTYMERTFTIQEQDWSTSQFIEIYSGFDSDLFNEINWVWLHFDYRPLAFYFETGKLRIWF